MALQVFDPTTEAKEQPIAFVPRPESLRNVRIGLVENTKYNSDKLLLRIAAILEKEYGAQSHIIRSKHGSGCRRTRRSSTNTPPTAMSSSPGSAIEGRAARAVCSTVSCLKSTAFHRPPLSPMCLKRLDGLWRRHGACPTINI